jgi:hypothetical protein
MYQPSKSSFVRVAVPVLVLTDTAPNSASATEETTCLRMVEWHIRGEWILSMGKGLISPLPPSKSSHQCVTSLQAQRGRMCHCVF